MDQYLLLISSTGITGTSQHFYFSSIQGIIIHLYKLYNDSVGSQQMHLSSLDSIVKFYQEYAELRVIAINHRSNPIQKIDILRLMIQKAVQHANLQNSQQQDD